MTGRAIDDPVELRKAAEIFKRALARIEPEIHTESPKVKAT
jgi:hypothetical protein